MRRRTPANLPNKLVTPIYRRHAPRPPNRTRTPPISPHRRFIRPRAKAAPPAPTLKRRTRHFSSSRRCRSPCAATGRSLPRTSTHKCRDPIRGPGPKQASSQRFESYTPLLRLAFPEAAPSVSEAKRLSGIASPPCLAGRDPGSAQLRVRIVARPGTQAERATLTLLPVACCLLPVACSLLPAACCLLPTPVP